MTQLTVYFIIANDSDVLKSDFNHLYTLFSDSYSAGLKGATITFYNNIAEHHKRPNIDTGFTYKYAFSDILSIESTNQIIQEQWKHRVAELRLAHEQFEFEFQLSYQLVVKDFEFPALTWSRDFLKFFGQFQTQLSLSILEP